MGVVEPVSVNLYRTGADIHTLAEVAVEEAFELTAAGTFCHIELQQSITR